MDKVLRVLWRVFLAWALSYQQNHSNDDCADSARQQCGGIFMGKGPFVNHVVQAFSLWEGLGSPVIHITYIIYICQIYLHHAYD